MFTWLLAPYLISIHIAEFHKKANKSPLPTGISTTASPQPLRFRPAAGLGVRQRRMIMKTTIIALLSCIGLMTLHAADEPFIPTALNAILPKIHAGMTIPEVEAALAPAYPNVKGTMGVWSGQTGYIEYKLDDRYSLSVSSITRDGKQVVHDKILLLLYDWPTKRRIDLAVYDWEKNPGKKPPTK